MTCLTSNFSNQPANNKIVFYNDSSIPKVNGGENECCLTKCCCDEVTSKNRLQLYDCQISNKVTSVFENIYWENSIFDSSLEKKCPLIQAGRLVELKNIFAKTITGADIWATNSFLEEIRAINNVNLKNSYCSRVKAVQGSVDISSDKRSSTFEMVEAYASINLQNISVAKVVSNAHINAVKCDFDNIEATQSIKLSNCLVFGNIHIKVHNNSNCNIQLEDSIVKKDLIIEGKSESNRVNNKRTYQKIENLDLSNCNEKVPSTKLEILRSKIEGKIIAHNYIGVINLIE